MPWQKPPNVDFFPDSEFYWPAGNVDLPMEDLFGDLYSRFNTVPMYIQDPNAFHHDVTEIACIASDTADFYARLQERRDERYTELTRTISLFDSFQVTGHFDKHMNIDQSLRYLYLSRNASLDALVGFIASFLAENHRGEPADEDYLLSSRGLQKKYGDNWREVMAAKRAANKPRAQLTDSSDQSDMKKRQSEICPPSVGKRGLPNDFDETDQQAKRLCQHTDMPSKRPETAVPETPDTAVPETPETEAPETPETEAPETPETAVPDVGGEHTSHEDATQTTSRNGPDKRKKTKAAPQRQTRTLRKHKRGSPTKAKAKTTTTPNPLSDRAMRAQRRARHKADAEQG